MLTPAERADCPIGGMDTDRVPLIPALGDPRAHAYNAAFNLGFRGADPVELPPYVAPSWRRAVATGFDHGRRARAWAGRVYDARLGSILDNPAPLRRLWTDAGCPEPDPGPWRAPGPRILAAARILWRWTGCLTGREALWTTLHLLERFSTIPHGPGEPPDLEEIGAWIASKTVGPIHAPPFDPPAVAARLIRAGRLRTL